MKKSVLFFIELFLTTVLVIFFPGINEAAFAYEFDDWDDEDAIEEDLLEEIEGEILAKIYMQGEFLDGDILKVNVQIKEATLPVLGFAFEINYNADEVAFLKYKPGKFLEQGGDPFYLVQNDVENEKIVFGETLRRDDNFPDGEGEIVELFFQIVEEGSFDFSFKNGVVSTLDVVRQDLEKVSWENLILKEGEGESDGLKSDLKAENKVSGILTNRAFPWVLGVVTALFSSFVTILVLKKRSK